MVTVEAKVVDEVVVVVLLLQQLQCLSLEFGHLSLDCCHLSLRPLPDLFLHSLEDGLFELLHVLLQVEHHVLHYFVEHLQKFTTQQVPHLALSLEVVLGVSDALAENRNEVCRVGQRFG